MTYYGINESPARVLILSHTNLDHTLPTCFFTIQFNIVLHLRLGLPRSHMSGFPIKNVYTSFISQLTATWFANDKKRKTVFKLNKYWYNQK